MKVRSGNSSTRIRSFWFRWTVNLVLAALAGITLIFVLVYSGALGPMPDREELARMKNPVASQVYSSDGKLIGTYSLMDRLEVTYDQISPHIVNALVAAEDRRFYEHSGIDYRSLLRVIVKTLLLQDESSGGGSTISQQLIKNYYPRKRYMILSLLVNKIRENILAVRLESVYSKQEILTLYLNTVSFSDNTFGVEAASRRFYSIPCSKLEAPQAAVLVAMLKGTYAYNPRVFPDRTVERRNVIVQQMADQEYLTSETADSIRTLPLGLRYRNLRDTEGAAPYFLSYIKPMIERILKGSGTDTLNINTDGLRIYTTIDSRLQEYATAAAKKHMKFLQSEFDRHWRSTKPWTTQASIEERAIMNSTTYKGLLSQKLSHQQAITRMKEPHPMTIFTWEGPMEVTMSSIDSIHHYLMMLNCGVVAMSPRGEVKAWVGGIDHQYFPFDHARESTRRQVGSTFKPLVYAAALEQGMKPCDYTSAARTMYTDREDWTPENGEVNYDRKYSMAGALANSVNTVSVKILEQAGINNTIILARRAGITSEIPEVPSIALGTPSISVLEMTTAYASFINEGRKVEPYYITRIETATGKVLWQHEQVAESTQVMDEDNARTMVELLRGVVDTGTARSLRSRYKLTGEMGGKTGTTQSNSDGWFMAVTPELVMGIWVGADDPSIHFRTTAQGQGAYVALPVFGEFYSRAATDPSLRPMTTASFSPLPSRLARSLSCDMVKEDKTLVEKIFGKKEEGTKEKKFGEPEKKRKNFWKRLFE